MGGELIETRISGVLLCPLKQFSDQRGALLHMLRNDSPLFSRFGEIYFSEINPGSIKGWKRHERMTQHFSVPSGNALLVIYDDRPDSRTHGILEAFPMGRPNHYRLLRLPPGLWYGWKGLGTAPALIANCTDLIHDPNEIDLRSVDDPLIPYQW